MTRRGWAWGTLATLLALTGVGCSARRAAPATKPAVPTPERALALERAGDNEGAARAFAAWRDRAPGEVRAHLGYVRVGLAAGRRSVLRDEYAARARAPAAREVDRVFAERLGGDQASGTMRALYDHASAREPGSPWWPLGLAEVELGEADAWTRTRDARREDGDRLAEREAEKQARLALARADHALERVEALPGAEDEADLYRGHVRALEGDLAPTSAGRQAAYRAALDRFERVTARAPTLLEGWLGLADIQGRLDEPGEALLAWIEAVRLAPGSAYARLGLARSLHALERVDDAAAQYREAARLEPRSAEPWLRLGDVYASDERWSAAAEGYRTALQRDPNALEALARLGGVLAQQGDKAGARDAYQRYVEQDGERKDTIQRALDRLWVGERR